MFKALVMACMIANPTDCYEFENTRHPLLTFEACKARAIEKANDINEGLPMKAISWKCQPIPKGRLT
jgi:hypothetical protein